MPGALLDMNSRRVRSSALPLCDSSGGCLYAGFPIALECLQQACRCFFPSAHHWNSEIHMTYLCGPRKGTCNRMDIAGSLLSRRAFISYARCPLFSSILALFSESFAQQLAICYTCVLYAAQFVYLFIYVKVMPWKTCALFPRALRNRFSATT